MVSFEMCEMKKSFHAAWKLFHDENKAKQNSWTKTRYLYRRLNLSFNKANITSGEKRTIIQIGTQAALIPLLKLILGQKLWKFGSWWLIFKDRVIHFIIKVISAICNPFTWQLRNHHFPMLEWHDTFQLRWLPYLTFVVWWSKELQALWRDKMNCESFNRWRHELGHCWCLEASRQSQIRPPSGGCRVPLSILGWVSPSF